MFVSITSKIFVAVVFITKMRMAHRLYHCMYAMCLHTHTHTEKKDPEPTIHPNGRKWKENKTNKTTTITLSNGLARWFFLLFFFFLFLTALKITQVILFTNKLYAVNQRWSINFYSIRNSLCGRWIEIKIQKSNVHNKLQVSEQTNMNVCPQLNLSSYNRRGHISARPFY